MSRTLLATRSQATHGGGVMCAGMVYLCVVSERRRTPWHGGVDLSCMHGVVMTDAYHGEPSVARMPVTATEGDCAAGDTRVGMGQHRLLMQA